MLCRHLAFALLSALVVRAVEVVPERVRFNEHIRPILSDNCFACHGPDDKNRKAKLRLDVREGALADLGGYAAIKPGQPDASELLKRVLSHDADEVMPPPKSKKPRITDAQVKLLRRWIEQDATYEGHWAFLPLREASAPAVKKSAWVRNDIDRFILARLEQEGLTPSAEADRATLIRRASLDLLGLLPSPEEVDAFVRDTAPDAFEKVVGKLLASPHYGERWGRHWLDQARYADSNGHSIDSERAMWPFRDWVIAALNRDQPFDQFTIEQIGGDLLPQATKAQLVATAFHRNTLINEEGGVDPEQMRADIAIDRVSTTGATWLGLTIGCAQCHTHKFDPITHREFYELYAFFNQATDVNNRGATFPVLRGEMFGRPVTNSAPVLTQSDWEKEELARLLRRNKSASPAATWSPAKYVEFDALANGGLQLLPDNSILSDGRGSANDTYRVVASSSLKKIAAVRLRVLTHDSLPKRGPGLAANGNFILTRLAASLGSEELHFSRAFADHEQSAYGIEGAIDSDAVTGWAINAEKGSGSKMNEDHEAVFVFQSPVEPRGQQLMFRLLHERNEHYLIGRFAIEFSENAPSGTDTSTELLTVLKIDADSRSPAQARLVAEAFARNGKGRKGIAGDTAEVMVMRDSENPRETFIFQRGDFTRPDKAAGALTPGVPAALSAGFAKPPTSFSNRLDLARWLVHPENPLTPRVTMNRVWMRYFGRGLVETEEDFGTQGSPPTHPELLDWLGREFIRRGWSSKAMHRLIVTSATYRQASITRSDLLERDPRNLLLARQSRVRVEAEIVRDLALSASGLLDASLGGPGVRPPQAEGVYAFTQNAKPWTASTGGARYRRALYTVFYRSAPYPLFTTFDAPDFQTVCTRRPRSDTPLQSLLLANDPAFIEIAQGFAARLLREVPGDAEQVLNERLHRACRLALSREPQAAELAALRLLYRQQAESFRNDQAAAQKVAGSTLAKAAAPEVGAALTLVARALLNTDNFITRE
jgi:Protein of unknown function (DUF1553)/Protein of unknown function (DUF1549)/Planctomycete cytochrome C